MSNPEKYRPSESDKSSTPTYFYKEGTYIRNREDVVATRCCREGLSVMYHFEIYFANGGQPLIKHWDNLDEFYKFIDSFFNWLMEGNYRR